MLLGGGLHPECQEVYGKVIALYKDNMFFRPLSNDNWGTLLSGSRCK